MLTAVFFRNAPAQDKSPLHSLEQAARDIGLYMNSDKNEFICFRSDEAFLLNGKPLKSVDQFIYLGNNISSTEQPPLLIPYLVNLKYLK